jgi:hypothetical protein
MTPTEEARGSHATHPEANTQRCEIPPPPPAQKKQKQKQQRHNTNRGITRHIRDQTRCTFLPSKKSTKKAKKSKKKHQISAIEGVVKFNLGCPLIRLVVDGVVVVYNSYTLLCTRLFFVFSLVQFSSQLRIRFSETHFFFSNRATIIFTHMYIFTYVNNICSPLLQARIAWDRARGLPCVNKR